MQLGSCCVTKRGRIPIAVVVKTPDRKCRFNDAASEESPHNLGATAHANTYQSDQSLSPIRILLAGRGATSHHLRQGAKGLASPELARGEGSTGRHHPRPEAGCAGRRIAISWHRKAQLHLESERDYPFQLSTANSISQLHRYNHLQQHKRQYQRPGISPRVPVVTAASGAPSTNPAIPFLSKHFQLPSHDQARHRRHHHHHSLRKTMLALATLSRRLTFFRSLLPQTRFLSTSRTLQSSPFLRSSSILRAQFPSPSAISSMLSSRVNPVRGMKTRSSVKRLCDGCKVRFTPPTMFYWFSGVPKGKYMYVLMLTHHL